MWTLVGGSLNPCSFSFKVNLFSYNKFVSQLPNKVSLVFFKKAHITKINLYHNFNENTKFEIWAYFGGKKFQIVHKYKYRTPMKQKIESVLPF